MRTRLEGVAFTATVCGAILQIWERNAPGVDPVLQGGASVPVVPPCRTGSAQEQGWVSLKTSCIVVVWRALCITGFCAAQGSLGNAS